MKLCIATPTHAGTFPTSFTVSLMNTVKAMTAMGLEVQWRVLSGSSFIHEAREQMAREFLASDYTDLLFIDDDMGWNELELLTMAASDVEVVGAICPKKKDETEFVVNLLRDASGNRIEYCGLLECAYVGTALLRIKREAFHRFPKRFFNIEHTPNGMIGEDAWFCREFRKNGGRVWADPRLKVTHTGRKDWKARYADEAR